MKLKKFAGFVLALLMVVSVFGFVNGNVNSVNAEGSTDKVFVYGYKSYTNEYVFNQFKDAFPLNSAGTQTIFDEDAKYYFDLKYEDGTNNTTESYYKHGLVANSESALSFTSNKNLLIKVYTLAEGGSTTVGEDNVVEKSDKQYVALNYDRLTFVQTTEDDSVYYNVPGDTAELNTWLEEFNDKVTNNLADKYVKDSFSFPSYEGYICSDYFDVDNLKLTYYYSTPNSDFTSTTSSSFHMNDKGTYKFYALAQDYLHTNLQITTDDLTLKFVNGVEGWYDNTDTLVIPVFSFDFYKVNALEISLNSVSAGYIGMKKDVSNLFTIRNDEDPVKTYTMYFTTKEDADVSVLLNGNDADIKSAGFDLVNDESEEGFNDVKLSFTPTRQGNYYVVCEVLDKAYNTTDKKVSKPVVVKYVGRTVNYSFNLKEFVSANYLSLIFLGIALLCLIGILCLLFIKPKKKVEEDTTAKPIE